MVSASQKVQGRLERLKRMWAELAALGTVEYDKGQLAFCGDGTFISRQVVIRRPRQVRIGNRVALDHGVYITTGADIGSFVHIAPYVTVIGGAQGRLVMGNFASAAAGSRIICGSDEHLGAGLVGPTIPAEYADRLQVAPVIFERAANVATNVVILPGVTLAEGTVVGACSLVRESTEPWGVYVGVPARRIKDRPSKQMLEYMNDLEDQCARF